MKEDNIKEVLLHSQAAAAWNLVGVRDHHGIAVPLASIHSQKSSGIGEFFDLVPLIQWCKEVGFEVIQLLPINDSAGDASPYNAISSCALNPVYLSLSHLPFMKEDQELQEKKAELDPLSASSRVLYTEVQSYKINFLRTYFAKHGEKLLISSDYKKYLRENDWVESYALFKTLKDKLGQNNYVTWPRELKSPSEEEYRELVHKNSQEISFYSLIQYLCYLQLKEVKGIANQNGVFLKGDIPILISPDSADVWHYCELFILDVCAGAPPDMYNKEGQYWGFPLFNWLIMKKQNYAWWEQRLKYASHFYDIYRLDHVIGFFRIWAILVNGQPKNGHFIPVDETLWGPQGKEILSKLISFTTMLPIAEDLGIVPSVVRPIMQELGICGTKVMRWERYWKENSRFIPIKEYLPISMTCLSTHDSPTLAQWWRDFPEEAKPLASEKKWAYSPTLTLEQRTAILRDAHHTSSLFHVNLLQEYLALFPDLSYANIDEERINVPGKILSTNWTYKYRPSVEEILGHTRLKEEIKKILSV